MQWDSIINQWPGVGDQWPWLIAAGVVLVLLGIFAAFKLLKSKPSPNSILTEKEQKGWLATGRIDFIGVKSTGDFLLQVEDTRIIEGVGGVERREIRWRKPTLDEIKSVVASYHAQRNLATTASYIVSASNLKRQNIGLVSEM